MTLSGNLIAAGVDIAYGEAETLLVAMIKEARLRGAEAQRVMDNNPGDADAPYDMKAAWGAEMALIAAVRRLEAARNARGGRAGLPGRDPSLRHRTRRQDSPPSSLS